MEEEERRQSRRWLSRRTGEGDREFEEKEETLANRCKAVRGRMGDSRWKEPVEPAPVPAGTPAFRAGGSRGGEKGWGKDKGGERVGVKRDVSGGLIMKSRWGVRVGVFGGRGGWIIGILG